MAGSRPELERKLFTWEEANAALPLVGAIARDICELARDLREREERLSRVQPPPRGALGKAYLEELEQAKADFEREQEKLLEYIRELNELGVELKDHNTGLVDFPCWMDDRVVYLCWRLGEPEVAFWHEIDAGFAGRQRLPARGKKQ
jgi:hypothetical protein